MPVADGRRLGLHAQRHDEGERLVAGEPQRAVDARVVGDGDPVAVEGHVDQVARPVPGQPAHPQQFQVVAQLPVGDAQVGRGLGDRDSGPGQQVRH